MTKQQVIAIIGEDKWDSFHNWSKHYKLQQYPYGEINYPKQLVKEFIKLQQKLSLAHRALSEKEIQEMQVKQALLRENMNKETPAS